MSELTERESWLKQLQEIYPDYKKPATRDCYNYAREYLGKNWQKGAQK